MTLPRYPEYRASGVSWLGEVPAHWVPKALKWVSTRNGQYGANVPAENYQTSGVRFIRTSDVSDNGELGDEGVYLSQELVVDCILLSGDILFSRSGTIGKSFLYDAETHGKAAFAGFLVRFTLKSGYNPKYLFYFSKSSPFRDFIQLYCVSNTIDNLNASRYSNMAVLTPPLPEQRAIVAYLDRETARLDDLIDKKRRLLALLKERRTAVITHAVTKGLPADEARAAKLPVDPTMKDSGVEWLGEVPAHWVVSDLGACSSKVGSGKTPLGGAETYETEGVPFLRSQNIHNEGLRLTDVVFINDHVHNAMMSSAVNPGDNLLNITGASIGRSCVAPINLPAANVNQHVCIIRARPDTVVNYYLHFYIISAVFQDYINGVQNGTSRQGLNFQQIRASAIGIPPLPEQHAIVAYLDSETARIDELTAKVEEAIELLGEYRTALITAAVTGQVDVRGAVEAW